MEERTRDLFEKIDVYPQAQSLGPEAFNYKSELDKMSLLQRLIYKFYFNISGFKSFNRELPNNFEHLARTIDVMGGALYAPVVSATVSLKNDERDLSALERAAFLIAAGIELKDDIFSGKLSPDTHNGQILEMGQYPNLFATSQIIESNRVRIYKAKIKNQITIICNGYFYILDLSKIDVKKEINSILSTLKQIVKDSKEISKDNYYSPGIISAAENRVQLKIFSDLNAIKENKKSLELVRESLFTLCLDLDTNPSSIEETLKVSHSENLFNRWFHSSLQLVVFNNSKAGIVINFSTYISGNNMMRAASEIARRSLLYQISNVELTEKNNLNSYIRLNWRIEEKHIKQAEKSFNKVKDNLNNNASFTINKVGKKDFGKYENHAVHIFTLALQLTAKKLIKKNTQITQFLAASKYRCRFLQRSNVSTDESIDFVDYIDQKSFNKEIALRKLDSAINSQIKVNREIRNHLTIYEQLAYYISSKEGFSKRVHMILLLLHVMFLWILGYTRSLRTEIIVSHPIIYEEVPLIGRPGIRIPYVKYFGLHYQIMDEKIYITMMPGVKWKIPNRRFIDELEHQLSKIINIMSN